MSLYDSLFLESFLLSSGLKSSGSEKCYHHLFQLPTIETFLCWAVFLPQPGLQIATPQRPNRESPSREDVSIWSCLLPSMPRVTFCFLEVVSKPLMPLAVGTSDVRACFQEYPLLFVSFTLRQREKGDRIAIRGVFCRKIIRWRPKLNSRKSMCILYDSISVSMLKTSFPNLKLQGMHVVNFKIIKGGHSLPIPASLTRNNFSEVNSVWFICI